MARFIAARLAHMLITLWAIVTGTFLLVHLLPGDPFLAPKLGATLHHNLLARYGLDLPLWRQYVIYWRELVHGDLGRSLTDPQLSVRRVIAAGLPVSAALGLTALAWSVPLGIVLGLAASHRPGGVWDRSVLALAVLGLSVPSFIVAIPLDWFFGVRVRLLPVSGWGSAAQVVLPAFCLGLPLSALVARLVRAQALQVLRKDYVLAARARGLTEAQVLVRHVLRHALQPVVTAAGPLAAGLLTGSFAIEYVFGVNGLGYAFVASVLDRDYPVVLAATLCYACFLVLFNFLVDLGYRWIDPRTRPLGEGG